MMRTEFAWVPSGLNAGQALQYLRETFPHSNLLPYIYVIDENRRLVGVFSLRALILADPASPIAGFMRVHLVCARLLDTREQMVREIAKYKLLALPVIDDDRHLAGIVAASDLVHPF